LSPYEQEIVSDRADLHDSNDLRRRNEFSGMKVLITGICGFVGSALALELKRLVAGIDIFGADNLSRPGSEVNRALLKKHGVRFVHADLRNPSDLDHLPPADWVIEAAANPSVLAGVTATASSRQLMEHNLFGTVNALEYCKRHRAGMILLSTSRVYSLAALSELPMQARGNAFVPDFAAAPLAGLSPAGVTEDFSTKPPLSLYGSAKLASEVVALDYGAAFNFPVHINRCGVLAGAGQFGKPDQGIFSFWLHSWKAKRPLKYIGFGGNGYQLRDCLHPRDLCALLVKQMRAPEKSGRVLNVSGGADSGISLANLSKWCERRFGPHSVSADPAVRQYDVPWLVLDSTRALKDWDWRPTLKLESILQEIAEHTDKNPQWLDLSSGT
jgi:CDP-paratose 2-epimerase